MTHMRWRFPVALTLLGLSLLSPGNCPAQGDNLLEVFDRIIQTSPDVRHVHYRALAAEQAVTTRQRHYLPSATLEANELWVDQTVDQTEIDVLRQGDSQFGNRRILAEIEQPIFDATLRPELRAARARSNYEHFMREYTVEQVARDTIEHYIEAARLNTLLRSLHRVIARLESEQTPVTRMLDEQLATLEDMATLNRNLIFAQRERADVANRLALTLYRLGLSEVPADWGTLDVDRDTSALDISPSPDRPDTDTDVSDRLLLLERTELEQQLSAAKRSHFPRLSLIGRYEYDDADDSVFGGAREITAFEVGLAVTWDIFEGGTVRSRMRELHYLKMAKDAEREATHQHTQRAREDARLQAEQAGRNVDYSKQLMEYQASIMDASQRGYAAGTQAYLNALEAFVLYESIVRNWENARFDQLVHRIRGHGDQHGWNRDLAAAVDALFPSHTP